VRPSLRPLVLAAFGLLLAAASLGAPAPETAEPHAALEGSLSFEIRDQATGELIPCKLTLLGVGTTPHPSMTTDEIGRREGASLTSHNRVFSLSGLGTVAVPVGTYDVFVSRGPEWSVATLRSVVVSTAGTRLETTLSHVLDTTGWISADLHVHAAPSFDSTVPQRDRVYEYVADGVEVLVSGDHNAISEYAALIEELGQQENLFGITGEEVTTADWGHFTAFPLTRALTRPGGGAIETEQRRPGQLLAALRRQSPSVLFQVNHPRLDPRIGYFYQGGFDSREDTAIRDGFFFDFDAIELLNGYQDRDRVGMERAIVDFHNLLSHGHLVTATGNSDTHRLSLNIAGSPRNYVMVEDDRPTSLTVERLVTAIRAHRCFFTTGPFVSLRVGSSNLGDLVSVEGGRVPVELTVQAAPWVSVSRVALYLGRSVVRRWELRPSREKTRLQAHVELPVAEDDYVVVRVDGDQSLYPIVGDTSGFVVYPMALTNPIFLDANHNGRFDPPGLSLPVAPLSSDHAEPLLPEPPPPRPAVSTPRPRIPTPHR
jgi:hypothetical protein